MERNIKFSDIEAAVSAAYENNRNITDGEIDPRSDASKDTLDTFGISVVLADGRVIAKGDADTQVPVGDIAEIPVHIQLLGQLGSTDELVKKCGKMQCAENGCKCHTPERKAFKKAMRQAGIRAHGIRAVSAVEPSDDPEGKYDILINTISEMIGGDPSFSDSFYKKQTAANSAANVENAIAAAEYYLYDNAPVAIDIYSRLMAVQLSSTQLATMGATIAADGVNPVTNSEAFDGKISAHIIGMMAAKGMKKMTMPWNVQAGIPAAAGNGGAVLGVIPGVMAIAATSPALNGAGVSARAAKAISDIMKQLDINAFGSACINVE